MARNFFENLPNTTTPLTAPRLNGLLDGDEAMGNIKVDSITSRNLFGGFNFTRTTSGITFTYNPNGTIIIDGTSTASAFSMVASNAILITLSPGTYVFSGGTSNVMVQVLKSDGTTIDGTTSSVFSKSFTLAETTDVFVRAVVSGSGNTFNNKTIYILLEKGSNPATFSEYKEYGYVSGSNENGSYIKYDDGTLIQWGQRNLGTVSFTSSWGNIYISDAQQAITYPINFITAPLYRNLTAISGSGLYFVSNTNGSYASNTSSFYLIRANNSPVDNVIIGFYAIGRWK